MTPKQQRFVAEYAIDLNATQAAIRAGYSERRAAVTGSELLAIPAIASAVAVTNRKVVASLEVTAERVLREYARIAFADMRHFATVKNGSVSLCDSDEWTEDDAAVVAELGETVSKDGGSVRFKLHSKTAALDSLAKHLRLLGTDDDQPNGERHLHLHGLTDEQLRMLASGRGS